LLGTGNNILSLSYQVYLIEFGIGRYIYRDGDDVFADGFRKLSILLERFRWCIWRRMDFMGTQNTVKLKNSILAKGMNVWNINLDS